MPSVQPADMDSVRDRQRAFIQVKEVIRRIDPERQGTAGREQIGSFPEQMNKTVVRVPGQRKGNKVFHIVG